MPGLPYRRLEAAAAELGVEATEVIDHALAGHLELALLADGVEYLEFEADFVGNAGKVERLLSPAHFVPPGRSPLIPRGLYRLPAIAAHHAATRGAAFIEELQDLEGDELFFLSEAYEVHLADVIIEQVEWQTFKQGWGTGMRGAAPVQPSSPRGAARAHTPVGGTSKRDQERLSLGADAMLTLRRAAELLPGNDKANRRALLEAHIVRDHNSRKMIRWGDVAALFPTVADQAESDQLDLERAARRAVEAEPRRRKRGPPTGDLRLADLD